MELITIILFVFVFFMGYIIGAARAWYTFSQKLEEAAKEVGIDLDEELKKRKDMGNKTVILTDKIHMLTLEKHNEVLYLFDAENGGFVCQGSTLEELAETLSKIKKIKVATTLQNDKSVWFVEGKVKNNT